MDRIAIISDIHGNIPALTSVLDDIEKRNIIRIICLGDLAGKGPSSAEAVDMIRKHCYAIVKGNWEAFLADQDIAKLNWHREKLGQERLLFMRELPVYLEFYMSGKLVRLCHASPNDLFHRTYLSTVREERIKLFEPTKTLNKYADIVGYGDIHGAHIENFNGRTIFNVGSVGNPLDMTLASYAIVEGEYDSMQVAPFSISIIKVPYDRELAIEHALATDMPGREAYINELKTGIFRGRVKNY